ncbi:uncharacterized protein LOC110936870 [Helianthus annuus]|uniref:uncharacterized protein LOC110936870 n=1 Tax=Helianthus annuus TaxID=4232 RepID=UPI000B8FD53A|nr:uncharacterized protein LOC110936870 [Helianthus annuus]
MTTTTTVVWWWCYDETEREKGERRREREQRRERDATERDRDTDFRRRIAGDERRSTTDDRQAVVHGGGGVLIPRSIPVNNPADFGSGSRFRLWVSVWFRFRSNTVNGSDSAQTESTRSTPESTRVKLRSTEQFGSTVKVSQQESRAVVKSNPVRFSLFSSGQ